jgi:hypothetical protein
MGSDVGLEIPALAAFDIIVSQPDSHSRRSGEPSAWGQTERGNPRSWAERPSSKTVMQHSSVVRSQASFDA